MIFNGFYGLEVRFMQIRMDKENRELKAHGSYEFPVNISYEQLSRYERGSFSWHWHPEIELTFVLSGQIGYQVNGKKGKKTRKNRRSPQYNYRLPQYCCCRWAYGSL
jgi:AraC family transcriptional regulator, melibiose operon regulatory protein